MARSQGPARDRGGAHESELPAPHQRRPALGSRYERPLEPEGVEDVGRLARGELRQMGRDQRRSFSLGEHPGRDARGRALLVLRWRHQQQLPRPFLRCARASSPDVRNRPDGLPARRRSGSRREPERLAPGDEPRWAARDLVPVPLDVRATDADGVRQRDRPDDAEPRRQRADASPGLPRSDRPREVHVEGGRDESDHARGGDRDADRAGALGGLEAGGPVSPAPRAGRPVLGQPPLGAVSLLTCGRRGVPRAVRGRLRVAAGGEGGAHVRRAIGARRRRAARQLPLAEPRPA